MAEEQKLVQLDTVTLRMITNLTSNQYKYKKLQDYYEGNHTFIKKKNFGDSTQPQNRVVVNYPAKIVDFKLGYFLGKPVTYTSNEENNLFLKKVEKAFKGWESLHNIKLQKKSQIHGKAYEVVYIDKNGQFKSTSFSPQEMIVLTDNTIENRVVFAIRRYKQSFTDNEFIDIYSDKEIITYQLIKRQDETEYSHYEVGRKENIFGECPVYELRNNEEAQGDFETVLSLVNMYDLVNSINVNELEYFRNCYLALKGLEGTKDEELTKMKTNRILKLPKEGEANFLTKIVDSQFHENVLNRLEKEIIQQSNIAILSTAQIQSNVSGVALKVKLQETENVISINEEYLKSLLYHRLRFFAIYLKIKENTEYDWTSINMTFTRNVPTNVFELSQIIQNLTGHVSNETLVSLLPFVQSVELEIKKLTAETGQDLNPEDIKKLISDAIVKFSKDNKMVVGE